MGPHTTNDRAEGGIRTVQYAALFNSLSDELPYAAKLLVEPTRQQSASMDDIDGVLFYVAFGIASIVVMAQRWKRWAACASLAFLFLFLGREFPIYLGFWLVGMTIAFLPRLSNAALMVASIAFVIILLVARMWQADFDQSTVYRTLKDYVVAIAFASLITAIRGKELRWFAVTAKLNKFFADFSYSLYLLHFPLMLFILAVMHACFNLTGIAKGYSPTSFEGRCVYLAVIFAVYVLAWVFSRLTEAKTANVRRFLKSYFQKGEVVNVH